MSTGISPFFLDHGYQLEVLDIWWAVKRFESPMLKGEAMVSKVKDALAWAQSSLAAVQSFQEEYANYHPQAMPAYNMGDKVWLDLQFINTVWPSKKLDIRHRKFTILEKIGSHAYCLDTAPGIYNIFHIWLLRLASDDLFPSQNQVDWQPPSITSDDGEEAFEVEAILDKQRSGGVRVAGLAKWTGYTEPTWEPADAMEGVTALDEFERLRGLESEEGCIVRG